MSRALSPALATAERTHPSLDVYFCAWAVAGVRTHYENVRSVAYAHEDITLHFVEINPHRTGGWIERAPLLANRTRGSLRSFSCTLPLFTQRRIDAVWTQADTALFPFIATRARYAHIPYVLSIDATTAQVESFDDYRMLRAGQRSRTLKHHMRDSMSAYCYRHAAFVLPWSQWAAAAIRAQFAVPEQRLCVVPPGVDVCAWPIRELSIGKHEGDATTASGPTRLLFVGGDFARKGGPLLLDVFRAHLRGRCELHLVTKAQIDSDLDVFVYRDLEPNDPRLHRLYSTCDALVLPTRADCFSLAAIEAMASGLPVITCPVGGIPEIVEADGSGWFVPVGDGVALLAAIEALLADPARAHAFGRRGRAIVEERFDAAVNTARVLSLIRALQS